MQFTRRQFGLGTLALAAVPPFAGISLTGCTPDQIKNELNTVLQEAINLIALVPGAAPYLADLKAAVAALKSAEAAWQAGSPVQVLISVLDTLLDVMAAIPESAPFIQLAQILVAGIVSLLGLIPVKGSPAVQARYNPLIGKKTVKSVADSKAQWAAVIAANPTFAVAALPK